jgi:hypothetical protein
LARRGCGPGGLVERPRRHVVMALGGGTELSWWPSPVMSACSEVEEDLAVWVPHVNDMKEETPGAT